MFTRVGAAVALVLLGACRGDRPTHDAAPTPADASGARFLVVTIRRIEVIDRHPDVPEIFPTRTATPNGASWDLQHELHEYDDRPPDRRPEIHTHELVLAVAERDSETFVVELDRARGYRWMLESRGWRIEDDGKVRLLGEDQSNAQLRWGIGPNGSDFEQVTVPLDRWSLGGQVMHDRGADERGEYSYHELEEVRFGPITTAPLPGALRGVAETTWDQQQRKFQWMVPENLRPVP